MRYIYTMVVAALLLAATGAEAETYIVNDTTEHRIGFLLPNVPEEYVVEIPAGVHPDRLTFSMKTAYADVPIIGKIPGLGPIFISQNVAGKWLTADSIKPDTLYADYGPITINPRAKQIRFQVRFGSTLTKHIRNIRITPYTGEIESEPQSIEWEQFLDNLTAGSETVLTATASSGLAVIYESSDSSVCDLRGNTLIAKAEGTAVITATQPGDEFFDSAEGISAYASVHLPSALRPAEGVQRSVTAYPNPVRDVLYAEGGGEITQMELYDMQGRLIRRVETGGGGMEAMECRDLPQGVYILKVTEDGTAHILHIMKVTM